MTQSLLNQQFHTKEFADGTTFRIPIRYIPFWNKILSSDSEVCSIVAHDRLTHQDVAIKKCRLPFAHTNVAKRTHREFVLTQMVNHKNVVRLLNVFTPHKTFQDFQEIYFVSEFVNFPLKFLLDHRDQVFMQRNGGEIISYLMYQILCGIRHLHKAGIVHRNLSIGNIVVDKKSRLKIIDLGSIRPYENVSNLNGYIGMECSYYQAPEIILGVGTENFLHGCISYDKKVDVWSAGCILAEIIRGTPLFPGTSILDQWEQIISTLGNPNESFGQNFPTVIRKFVHGAQKIEPKSWEDIIPDNSFPLGASTQYFKFPMCNVRTARDLLSKLLVIDPIHRLSIDQALEHSFVNWQHDPRELGTETNPHQHYNSYIEQLDLTENEWKTLIFAEIKQYEMMKAQENLSTKHDCEACKKYRCDCLECTKMNIERLLQ